MNYTTAQLAEITGAILHGDGNLVVNHIAFDSRNIFSSVHTAFLAINTSKNSGEKYILDAVEKGIQVIISEKPQTIEGICNLVVEDSLQFVQKLAKYHVNHANLNTIGITGSNGKTIVKEWLFQSLSEDFAAVKSPKSFNSQLGLPISLLKISPEHEVGIFEVGISKPGEMEILEGIFSPKIGILTHIGSAHESNFEDQLQLITEKILLFKNSETVIFNGDNPLVCSNINELHSGKRLISYGLKPHNDVFVKNANNPSDLEINYFGEEIHLPATRRDEATLSNALCVVAVLKEFGFSNEKIIAKVNALKVIEMRLESVNGVRNNLIVNDYYNLDLDSLRIAYQFINEYNKPSKTLVLTDFIEGKNSAKLYQTASELTNQQNFNRIFLIGEEIEKFKELFKGDVHTFSSTDELVHSHLINHLENELILLKGARKFSIEKIKEHLELQKHDTVLEVNLNAILHNINFHKSLLKPDTKMMAMVKAYSYGLGGYEIAEFLQHHHIDYLGVAYADEGVDLRKNGISAPIMVMNPEQHSYGSIIDYNLEPEIYSFRVLQLFNEELIKKEPDKKFPIHIKIETGMNRLGFREDEIEELVFQLSKMNVDVVTVFSHLSSADSPEEAEYTLNQISTFEKITDSFSEKLGYKPIRHILNSSGITGYSKFQFDMVRIGIGMIGVSPDAKIQAQLRNAVTFKTVISQISPVSAGASVGYSRRHRTLENSLIATIPVGYADGVPRLIGNGVGHVGIGKKLYPIVGNVCMDMMMVDIGNSMANEGDEVIIFNSNPSLQQYSGYCQTIPYEALTSISRRVKRIYIKD